MQSLTFKALLFFAGAFFSVLSSASAHNEPATSNSPANCPPPPAPTGLTVTAVTATSISISWSAASGPFFQVAAVDLTTSFTYPVMAGSSNQANITGLQPGHVHGIYVRVSKCAEGEFGDASYTEGTTGIIIIDMVGGFQEGGCTPNTPFSGNQHLLCVKKSTFVTSPFNNESKGRITFDGTGCTFGFAYTEQAGAVPKLTVVPLTMTGPFNFQQVGTGMVKCTYGSSPLQQIELFNVSPQEMTATDAKAFIKFSEAFSMAGGHYAYCTRCGEGDGKGRSSDEDGTAVALTNEESPILVSPNPFTEYTRIQYSVAVPTLVNIQLYDAIGRLVHTVQPNTLVEAGEYTATVQGSSLPKGSYFAVVQKGDQHQVISLVKQE